MSYISYISLKANIFLAKNLLKPWLNSYNFIKQQMWLTNSQLSSETAEENKRPPDQK